MNAGTPITLPVSANRITVTLPQSALADAEERFVGIEAFQNGAWEPLGGMTVMLPILDKNGNPFDPHYSHSWINSYEELIPFEVGTQFRVVSNGDSEEATLSWQ